MFPPSNNHSTRGPFIPRDGVFGDYPYLIVRVVGPMLHLAALPADRPSSDLLRLASLQTAANHLPCLLVLAPNHGVAFDPDLGIGVVPGPPASNLVVCDRLQLAEEVGNEPELSKRQEALRRFVEERRPDGFFIARKLWFATRASEAEREALAGTQANGVLNGLTQCDVCGDWRGRCLDPNPADSGWIIPVHCLCQNDTRCARCLRPLAQRRLNGFHYDPRDGQLRMWPGFMAFDHECEG